MNSASYSDEEEEVIVTGRRPTWQPQSDAVWAMSQARGGIDLGAGFAVTIQTAPNSVGTGNEPSPESAEETIVTGRRTQNNGIPVPVSTPGVSYTLPGGLNGADVNVVDNNGDGEIDEWIVSPNRAEQRASQLSRQLTAGAARLDVAIHGALLGAAGLFSVTGILARLGLSASSANSVEGILASMGIMTSVAKAMSQLELVETLDRVYFLARYNHILQNPQLYEHYIDIPYTNTFYDSNEFDN
jgi:hypothetical protein